MVSSSKIFRYPCQIPFHLTDTAGILFFGHIFTLAHQAFEHFVIHQLECPWSEWFQNSEWIVPIKKTEAQFHYPLYAGQVSQVEIFIQSISTSSFTSVTTFYQQELCSEVKTVHVFCNAKNLQKIPIPIFLIPRLETCLQNVS